jgi:hypothetical protein
VKRSLIARALPQRVHLMPRGSRTGYLCGPRVPGDCRGLLRLNPEGLRYLARFLKAGGSLCPDCAREEALASKRGRAA